MVRILFIIDEGRFFCQTSRVRVIGAQKICFADLFCLGLDFFHLRTEITYGTFLALVASNIGLANFLPREKPNHVAEHHVQ